MEIPQYVWEIIETEVQKTQHGTVTLIAQDGCLVQIDKEEKIRLSRPEVAKRGGINEAAETKLNRKNLRLRITQVLHGLRFGQVVIVIKDNKVVQIEKMEKHRVNDLTGLFGEGI